MRQLPRIPRLQPAGVCQRNQENGFTVLNIVQKDNMGRDVPGSRQTLVGVMPEINQGMTVEATGEMVVGKYGPNLKVSSIQEVRPTDGSYTKHSLPQRVFRLSDGTPVQRDLMAALNILCSKKENRKDEKTGRRIVADVPDREMLLDSLAWFVPAVETEMQRMREKSLIQTVPSAIGTGAWTALLGAGKSEPYDAGDDVYAPNPTGEDTRAVTRGHRERNGAPDTRSTARNQADTKRKAEPSCGTPRL